MILADFYEAILKRIVGQPSQPGQEAIKGLVPSIRHFDYFNMQYYPNEEGVTEPFIRPAVFFEYNPQEWVTSGRKQQATETTFRLHVVSNTLANTAAREKPELRGRAHEHLGLLDEVSKALQGFNGEGFGSIGRKAIEPWQMNDQLRVHIITFRVRLTDRAMMPTTIPVADATNATTPSLNT